MRTYVCLANVVCLIAVVGLAGCGTGQIAATPVREIGVAASCAAISPAAQFAHVRRVLVGVMLPGPTTRLDGRHVLASPARMRVARYLKGDGPNEVKVLTAVTINPHGVTVAEDGIEPQAGERWKIYTGSRRQPFATSLCGGSARVAVTSRPAPNARVVTSRPAPNARAALNLWRDFPVGADPRPVVPLGEGIVLDPNSGFPDLASKLAYLEGRFVLHTPLPDGPGAAGRYGPGAAGRYRVIPAAAAYRALRATRRPQQDKVAPLIVTAVRLGAVRFATDRGPASLPAWRFYFRGIAAPASVLALALPDLFTPPAGHRFGPPGPGYSIELSATASRSGTLLTLSFPGAPPGTGPCAASYAASTVADRRAVAVTITTTGGPVPSGVACPAIAVTRTAVVHLGRALGARVLVSSGDGGAIAVTAR